MQNLVLRAMASTVAIMLLSACAVARGPVVNPALGTPANLPPTIALQAKGRIAQDLAEAMAANLATRGVRIDPASQQVLTIAVSEHPASMGVTLGEGLTVSSARKHHWYDACHARRLSTTVMLRQADAPQPQALLRGSIDNCVIGKAAIQSLAAALAQSL